MESRIIRPLVAVSLASLIAPGLPLLAQSGSVDRQAVNAGGPRVSPNGRDVGFWSTRDGGGLFVMNTESRRVRRVTPPGHEYLPFGGGWSPDGQSILVFRDKGDSAGIYTADIKSGRIRIIAADSGVRSASWSPDGTRLVFSKGQAPSVQLYVMDASGGWRRQLTSDSAVHFAPVWSPDGKRIAFMKRGGAWVMNIDGSQMTRVSGSIPGSYPVWSPDGNYLAFASTTTSARPPGAQWSTPTRVDIVIVRPDGSDLRRVTTQTEDLVVETPSWFPDGKSLLVQLVRDGVTDLRRLSLTGRISAYP